jgi:hypothetical protein
MDPEYRSHVIEATLSSTHARKDRTTFETGPARAVSAIPAFSFLKFEGFTGVGFAHPTPVNIRQRNPKRSKCLAGFMLILPLFLPVLSPSISAVRACADSWNGMAISRAAALDTYNIMVLASIRWIIHLRMAKLNAAGKLPAASHVLSCYFALKASPIIFMRSSYVTSDPLTQMSTFSAMSIDVLYGIE